MRYICLACDFDGTIARDGIVSPKTLEALAKVRTSRRKLVLCTGRQLADLRAVFPELDLFDRVVCENGAVVYKPSSKEVTRLAERPPLSFIEELGRRGVEPLSVGECIVATWRPHEKEVLDVIRDMNLGLQIIFNKSAVMVLPSGVSKGTGLESALGELGLSAHNVVAVGDAENDHGFMAICECSVAVSNALPAIKERADWVTQNSHGEGVEELIALLLRDDLKELSPRLKRHEILLGTLKTGEQFTLPAYCPGLLVAGPSGGGKSRTVSAIVERLVERKYQVCVFDPEGDYDQFKPLISVGGPEHIPVPAEIQDVLANPSQSISINLLGVLLTDRPSLFRALLAHLEELRTHKARPHWIVVDEAHHVLPAESHGPPKIYNAIFVTVNPDSVSPEILKSLAGIIVVGSEPGEVIKSFNRGAGTDYRLNAQQATNPQSDEVLVWVFSDSSGPKYIKLLPAEKELQRHKRKYAVGELGKDKSFYFRGPRGQLSLRAQNMSVFVQLAEGLDDETWMFHLSNGDYSQWLKEKVKDYDLASVVENIEANKGLSAAESKQQIINVIRAQYTAPAEKSAN